MSLDWTRSRKKWYRMSKCLTFVWNAGSSDSIIAALLSQSREVGSRGMKPMLDSRVRNHRASFDASNATVYSASQDDVATVRCRLDCQDIGPEPKVNK